MLGTRDATFVTGSYSSLPSNLLKGFQRFGILRNFCAGVSTDLGSGLGLLRVQSLPGVNSRSLFGLILDSTGHRKL